MRQRIEFIAAQLDRELELADMPYEVAWPCHPLWRHVRGHRLCESTLIRSELGFEDPVPADVALARSVDWLVANPASAIGAPRSHYLLLGADGSERDLGFISKRELAQALLEVLEKSAT